jgi:hypothetical protein
VSSRSERGYWRKYRARKGVVACACPAFAHPHRKFSGACTGGILPVLSPPATPLAKEHRPMPWETFIEKEEREAREAKAKTERKEKSEDFLKAKQAERDAKKTEKAK